MTLEELFANQQRDLEGYKTARDMVWQKLREEHQQITEAMGGEEHLPKEIRTRIDEQINAYRQEWTMYTGDRHRAITEQHNKQREQLTGKPTPLSEMPTARKKPESNPVNDRQEKLQKIIAQQQAIRNRQQSQKRKR